MAAWGFCTLLCGLAFGQEPALHHGNILAKQEKRIPIREIRKSKPEEARIGSNTHIQIHHTGSKAYLNPDMAKITLKVTFDWGDGSGYQILFDADHNLADSIIPVSTNNLFSDTGHGRDEPEAETQMEAPEGGAQNEMPEESGTDEED